MDWACKTDASGVGTCQTEKKCTVENNIRRCRTCTETITVQSSDDADDTDGSRDSNTGDSTRSVQ